MKTDEETPTDPGLKRGGVVLGRGGHRALRAERAEAASVAAPAKGWLKLGRAVGMRFTVVLVTMVVVPLCWRAEMSEPLLLALVGLAVSFVAGDTVRPTGHVRG